MLGRKLKRELTGLEHTHANNSASSVLMRFPSPLFQSRDAVFSTQILNICSFRIA